MTVIVGLRSLGGVVLCADQQVSAQGAFKYNECKIAVDGSAGAPVAFAYSGLPGLFREAREKIMRKVTEAEISQDSLYQAADEVFTDMGRTLVDVDLKMLIGTSLVFESPTLFKFDGKAFHKADNYSFLGAGDSSLLRYMAEILYSPHISLEDATNLAIYMVQKAEDYVDGCGGPIDVAKLPWGDGSCVLLPKHDIQARIRTMEAQEPKLASLLLQSFSSD